MLLEAEMFAIPRPGVAGGQAEEFSCRNLIWWCSWSACWRHRAGSALTRPPACHRKLARWSGAARNRGKEERIMECIIRFIFLNSVGSPRQGKFFFFLNHQRTIALRWVCNVKEHFVNSVTYLYGTVQVPWEAVLNQQGREIENSQQQSFELAVVWPITHQHPGHVFHGLSSIAQDPIESVKQVHPVVQLTLRREERAEAQGIMHLHTADTLLPKVWSSLQQQGI